MRDLKGLGLDPTEELEVLEEEVVFWQAIGELDAVVAAALRHPCNSLLRNKQTHDKHDV